MHVFLFVWVCVCVCLCVGWGVGGGCAFSQMWKDKYLTMLSMWWHKCVCVGGRGLQTKTVVMRTSRQCLSVVKWTTNTRHRHTNTGDSVEGHPVGVKDRYPFNFIFFIFFCIERRSICGESSGSVQQMIPQGLLNINLVLGAEVQKKNAASNF